MQATERLKHFKRIGIGGTLECPFVLFDVRVDYHDVRSGQSGSETGLFSATILEDEDLDWTPDMVRRVSFDELEETVSPYPVDWPESAQNQITRYMLKHFHRTAWKNVGLALYSGPGESIEDFNQRCLEELVEDRRIAVTQIRDVFLHRFIENEQRVMSRMREEGWDERSLEARLSEIKDAFSEVRDRFSRCFLNESWEPLSAEDLVWTRLADVEAQERLAALRDELISQHNMAIAQVKRRLTEIEPYELALNHADIGVTPIGFLWEQQSVSHPESDS